ncbi:V-type proton ATPase subunit F [Datura stramonium]|uniref:V-type proton ATPase subunit F n=1 Tax=Datura stramonium TaxID=4076 RepID=A0ABS8RQT3_DATST|nr:V-type proton ATPase subunit F [Datura stramonium]
MIADQDTMSGFLLAGVGNVDLRRKTNYLIVDSNSWLIVTINQSQPFWRFLQRTIHMILLTTLCSFTSEVPLLY